MVEGTMKFKFVEKYCPEMPERKKGQLEGVILTFVVGLIFLFVISMII